VVSASKDSQIWITTHSTDLSDYILDLSGHTPLVIEKVVGETRLVGVKLGEHPDNQDDDDEDDGNVPNDNMAGSGSNRGKSALVKGANKLLRLLSTVNVFPLKVYWLAEFPI
jgi:hypothetical protein